MKTSGNWSWQLASREFNWSPDLCVAFGRNPELRTISCHDLNQYLGQESAAQWIASLDALNALQPSTELIIQLPPAPQRPPRAMRIHAVWNPEIPAVVHGDASFITTAEVVTTSPDTVQLLNTLPTGVIQIDERHRVWFANTCFLTYFSIPAVFHYPVLLHELLPPAQSDLFIPALNQFFENGQSQQIDITLSTDDSPRYVIGEFKPLLSRDKQRHCCLVITDVTEYRHLQDEMRASEERWRFALESSGDGVWDWNLQTNVEYLSDRLKAIYGYAHDDLEDIAEELDGRTHPDDIEKMKQDRQAHFDGLTPTYINEHRVQCKDGSWKWILSRGTIIQRNRQGQPVRMVGTHTDISERRQAEAALKESEERLRTALSATHQGLYDLNVQTGNAMVSKEYAEMLGYVHDSFIENRQSWLERLHPEDYAASEQAFQHYLSGKLDEYRVEFRQRHADGSWVWVLSVGALVEWDSSGQPLRMLGTVLNITDRKHSEALIWQQANIDPLTGLPNRRMFYDRLEQDIKRSKRNGIPLAVLFIDLDFFKEINDTLGHAMGDALLVEAAHRLRECVRESDTVARLGGDEFTISLPDQNELVCIEDIAKKIIQKLSDPFFLGGETIYISASIGITIYPRDANDLADLIKHADQAMYAAKDNGRNRFSYFTPSLQTAAIARLRLSNELRAAVNEQHLQVYFQPIIELETGMIKKAEALIRWKHAQHGFISPAEFIPIAESSGLIHQIGEWVFKQSVQWVSQWRQSVHPDFQISVNQSPAEFQNDQGRYTQWIHYLHQCNLPGQAIAMEITEGLLLDANSKVASQLLEFRDAGIQVSIDDFGTGYSSLSYLKKFDIDYLKIDRSFISNLCEASSDYALCEAIIMMAHKLGLKVVAEGVETSEQATLLRTAKCDYVQGYLYSRPLPPEEFNRFLLSGST